MRGWQGGTSAPFPLFLEQWSRSLLIYLPVNRITCVVHESKRNMIAQVETSPAMVDAVASPITRSQHTKPATEDPNMGLFEQNVGNIKHAAEPEDGDTALDFDDLPPFPSDVPVAPLLRISLQKLLVGDQEEVDRLWDASCHLGFFYLDMRGGRSRDPQGLQSPEREELTENIWASESPEPAKPNSSVKKQEEEANVDGDQLLKDADALFNIGEKVFELPVEEKLQYDFADQGSYYGYKGLGAGVIDSQGTKDSNEFYNVSKDDILGISERLPAPEILHSSRDLLESFMRNSHAIVILILRLLNARLDLPPEKLASLHRLAAPSGDQVRWVCAPPQPQTDSKAALGEHTDFGSVTVLFNRLGGLQVYPAHTNDWRYVKPLHGHAVVNLGDAMVKFTAGVLRSNIHRVVSPPGEQAGSTRMSLVYFARPEDDVILKALEGSKLIDSHIGETVRFKGEEEITSKEWIKRRALGRRSGGDWANAGGTEGQRTGD